MFMNLQGKKALVTGASGGLGQAIVQTFSQLGCEVALTATNADRLSELAGTLATRHQTFTCDLSDISAVEALYAQVEEQFGELDILVCNAGITADGLAMRMKTEDFTKVLDINLKATFILNREAIKKMMKRKHGRIINIASVVGFTGNPGQANYVASKAGMVGMSKALAAEVASRNITVNCVAPGFIATPMTDVLTDDQKEVILSAIPMHRIGDPTDVANGVAFLASDEASYITGTTLHINGGMYMN